MAEDFPLGRRVPTDNIHVDRYPVRLATVDVVAERSLVLNSDWIRKYDQGVEGACVGFASSYAMSLLNRRFYDARWLYQQAQLIDEWGDTPPAEGTSVRAGMDVLRLQGHRRLYAGTSQPAVMEEGIEANRWARNVDEVRACLAMGVPVVLGIDWFTAFDRPEQRRTGRYGGLEWWIGAAGVASLGRLRGGHAICAYAVSDRRQGIRLVNSWGERYPRVWLPYDVLDYLLRRAGEATVITDRSGVVP